MAWQKLWSTDTNLECAYSCIQAFRLWDRPKAFSLPNGAPLHPDSRNDVLGPNRSPCTRNSQVSSLQNRLA